ncbi:MAG: AccI family restriction endonuclease [Saprospiraceae bacterium]|nr:AccI family restriction endonuclease [Saprospiraceae bacterium]
MTYKEKIQQLIDKIPTTIVDWSVERVRSKAPTQAFSEFLTNREQGDWAERLVLSAINALSEDLVAVHYGKSDARIAGEEGFEQFYEAYQDELDTIGKRPDILVLKKSDYDVAWNYNISSLPKNQLDVVVPKGVAGIEIRSSSFLIEKYDAEIQRKQNIYKNVALSTKILILENYIDLLTPEWIALLNSINETNLGIISFRVPNRRSSQRLVELTNLFKDLKDALTRIQKRDFLSITPKVEDIKVVHLWTQTYNVPHFYFQVFFDKVYGISFEQILELISDSSNEGQKFFVEGGDVKNQNKTTIKINSKVGKEIAYKVDFPNHKSQVKELDRGRLLFHVTFEGGTAYLNVTNLFDLLNLKSS